MNLERDKYLTEAMCECWHRSELYIDEYHDQVDWRCAYCTSTNLNNNNFSTWEGFGKLWEWVSRQENMMCELASRYNGEQAKIKLIYISPDRFADAVYSYLKEKDK